MVFNITPLTLFEEITLIVLFSILLFLFEYTLKKIFSVGNNQVCLILQPFQIAYISMKTIKYDKSKIIESEVIHRAKINENIYVGKYALVKDMNCSFNLQI